MYRSYEEIKNIFKEAHKLWKDVLNYKKENGKYPFHETERIRITMYDFRTCLKLSYAKYRFKKLKQNEKYNRRIEYLNLKFPDIFGFTLKKTLELFFLNIDK